MLVLSRKIGERIHIGEDMFIEVRRIAGSRVTLAVSAPREVRILRGELKEAADSFNVLADSASAESESENDTVIMKGRQNPAASSNPAPANPESSALGKREASAQVSTGLGANS